MDPMQRMTLETSYRAFENGKLVTPHGKFGSDTIHLFCSFASGKTDKL